MEGFDFSMNGYKFDMDNFNVISRDNNSFQMDNISIKRRIGFTKKINIINASNKKAYVIITSTPIKSISTIGVDGIGSVQFQQHGEYKCQELLILPKHTKLFELDTKSIYITVLIEVEKDHWKQFRKNRLVNARKNDYRISEYPVDECVDIDFLDYSKK